MGITFNLCLIPLLTRDVQTGCSASEIGGASPVALRGDSVWKAARASPSNTLQAWGGFSRETGGKEMGSSCKRWTETVRMTEGMKGKSKIFVASASIRLVFWTNFIFLHLQSYPTQQIWLFIWLFYLHQILQTSMTGGYAWENSSYYLPFLFFSWT